MLSFINSIHQFFILKGINFPEYTQMSLFITLFFSFQEWMSPSLVFQMDLQGKTFRSFQPLEGNSHSSDGELGQGAHYEKISLRFKFPCLGE